MHANAMHRKTEWWEKFVKDAITLSVSFIPVAGPFLAIAFPLGWTLIRDPNAFVQEIRNVVPGADISAQYVNNSIEAPPQDTNSTFSTRLVEQIEKEAIELRAFLLDDWQKLMLPSQGAAQESTIGVKLPMVSIGIGQKPEPDGEREASKQVFPADKPPRLDSETPKNDAFVLFQAMMDALGKQATWAPSTEEYTLELQIEAGDLAKAEGIVPEIDEVQPFGG